MWVGVCVCVRERVCTCALNFDVLRYPPPPLHTTHRRVRDRSRIWVCSNYPGVEACRFQAAIQRQRRTLGPLALEPPRILVLRHNATHCHALQHIATHCNTLPFRGSAEPSNPWPLIPRILLLQHTTIHSNALQHIAAHC